MFMPSKNDLVEIKRVSIDEISMRKGQQDFITVVSDIDLVGAVRSD